MRHEAANPIVLHMIPCHSHARTAVTQDYNLALHDAGGYVRGPLDRHCGDDSEVIKVGS